MVEVIRRGDPVETRVPAEGGTRSKLPSGSLGIIGLCLGTPVLFLLGAAVFSWAVAGFVVTLSLITRPKVLLPRGVAPLLLFVAWIPLTAVNVHEVPTLFLFGFRFMALAAVPAYYIWLVNAPTSVLPSSRVVSWLSTLFLTYIAFAYLAMLLPHVDVASPVQRLLPAGIVSNSYVYDITRVRFAEAQDFLSYSFVRPAAPMAYANSWGSTVGMLLPFFIHHWVVTDSPRRRWRYVLVPIVFLPVVTSLNRGLWVVTAIGLVYVAVREFSRGRPKPLLGVAATLVAAFAIVAISPLGTLVQDRLSSTEDSNADRTSAYVEAFEGAVDSPLLGHGQPIAQEDGLPVGTHGLVWYTMFSHGFPALILFGWWLVATMWRTRIAPTPIALWAHVAVVIFSVETLFYGLLPQVGLVGIAAGIAVREKLATPDVVHVPRAIAG